TAGVLSQSIFHQATHALNLCCLNLQVGNLALGALGCWLVNQDARVRKRCALAGSTCCKKDSGSGCSLSQAHSLYIRTHVAHGVIDGHQRGERDTRGVDVHGDLATSVHALEDEQLRHDVIGGGVIDLSAEEDNSLFEELRVWVCFFRSLRGLLNK